MTVVAAAKLTAVVATTKAVTTAATLVAIVVVGATVTATAVGSKDIGGNSNGGGHRQQLTITGSKDGGGGNSNGNSTCGCSNDCRGHANNCPGRWRRQNRLHHRLGSLWVLVVTVVCGVVRAGCVCAAHPCCFVRLTRISASNIRQTTAYWGSPERSQ